jgi:response regulator of citrate/malate metabolism
MGVASAAARRAIVPLGDWRVMIVEDSGPVASLHRRIVEATPYLRTAHIARSGRLALRALAAVRPDLVLLDLSMDGETDGLALLRKLRRDGDATDVIVVTASRSSTIVEECTRLGVVDYLVKPVSAQRLRHALATFAMRRRTFTRCADLSQADVDGLQAAGTSGQAGALPRGIIGTTLAAVVSALESSEGAITADEIAAAASLSRATSRRYLEYLQVVGVVEMARAPEGRGRPPHRYRLSEQRP